VSTSTPNQGATVVPNSLMPRRNWRNPVSASRKNQAAFGWFSGPGCVAPCGIERGKSQKISSLNPIPLRLFFARSELRRPRDVSPLILRKAHNQGIDILRSPKTNLIFDRWQNIISDNQHRPLCGRDNWKKVVSQCHMVCGQWLTVFPRRGTRRSLPWALMRIAETLALLE
jgi:hypothetical protein